MPESVGTTYPEYIAATVDVTVIRGLLEDAYQTSKSTYVKRLPRRVWVDQRITKLRRGTAWNVTVLYHYNDRCSRFVAPPEERLALPLSKVKSRAYTECPECNDLSVAAWCDRERLDVRYVIPIMQRLYERVPTDVAIKLLRGIGEQPHPSLLSTSA